MGRVTVDTIEFPYVYLKAANEGRLEVDSVVATEQFCTIERNSGEVHVGSSNRQADWCWEQTEQLVTVDAQANDGVATSATRKHRHLSSDMNRMQAQNQVK